MRSDVPTFHTETSDFCVGTALFPDVDVAWDNGPAFLGVQTSGDHGEDAAGDGVENLEGIAGGAYADAL